MIFFLSILSEQYRKFHRLSGIIFLSLFLFQASFPVEIEAAKKKKSSKVTINLPQTLILKEFIKIISEHTGTVFVYEEKNMRGQMSITAPRNSLKKYWPVRDWLWYVKRAVRLWKY